jgi:lipoprotein-releasing system permease protein
MYTTTGAILLVACFGIFNIISTLVNEKSRDIAILKSMGFTAEDIQVIFILQGLLIGVSGMLTGFALGYSLSRLLESVRISMKAMVTSDHLFIVYDISHYVTGGAACMAAATLAAWIPARRAARMKPVDIIRGAAG